MAKKALGGMAGIFLEEHKVLAAARRVRESGFVKFDAITPYPVHGMEEACGIKRSWIPYVTFIAGSVGLIAALALVYYTSVVDWAINVGGKPMFSLPAFVPIMFELTILFAALASVAAMFIVTGMPKIDPPVIDKDLTCHKFAIFIPENDVGYNQERVEKLLTDLGADEVKKVAEY
ncbi:DUF3341 domain-containing protein [Pseudobdellovibrio exovorus]|uniref:DUF3341 domain-containing protein n=1 Tax=Pseudobdellovibrio exovorus JSS TaxID=1184267 RepID=M4VB70_9BACT|nr:DUF3341 domain-containing protein [Pseudobdellovibrio exovorus]AGH95725.1 hypothetical protein A11Q_1509 [Pseudobdellovibrio exovorus JSS]